MTTLSIDPTKKDDAFYRYKMPAVMTKIEGNGNGIKTVFPNIHDIATKLNRPPEIINKFFGKELGAQATFVKTDDKFLVMGSHTQQRIQEKVYDFIGKFVLCKFCRNPETDMFVGAKDKLSMTCKGCGKVTDIPPSEHVTKLFVLHYAQKQKEAAKKGPAKADAATAAVGPASGAGAPAAGDGAAAAADTPAEEEVPVVKVVEKTIETTVATTKENPVTQLARTIKENVGQEALIAKVYTLKTECNIKDKDVMRLVFRATIEASPDQSKPLTALADNIDFVSHFSQKPDAQLMLIKELLVLCHAKAAPEKVAMGLKLLWEEEALPAGAISDWYHNYKPNYKEVPKDFYDVMKTKAAPFMAWLEAADE